jgi:TRAP-type uncharacterized transport system substrate-binding protein
MILSPVDLRPRLGWLPALVCLAGAALFASPGAEAAPVRTLWVAGTGDGSMTFAEDLAALWDSRNGPTPERLAIDVRSDPAERVRAVNRGRADLTILSVDDAARLLPEHPRAAALGVLWPLYVHALTRGGSVQSLRLPLSSPAWVLESAPFAHEGLWERAGNGDGGRPGLELFPADWLPDALAQLRGEVLVFAAPAPLRELSEALQADPALRLVNIDPKLVEEWRLHYPWVRTVSLSPGVYPGVRGPLELPVRYQVLVGRLELGRATVQKVLDTVYGARDGAARIDPLFGQIRADINATFSPLLPFHPIAAEALGLSRPAR